MLRVPVDHVRPVKKASMCRGCRSWRSRSPHVLAAWESMLRFDRIVAFARPRASKNCTYSVDACDSVVTGLADEAGGQEQLRGRA